MTARAGKPPPTRLRRLARWLIRLALVVVALAVIAVVALHTEWGRDRLRGYAERTLSETFPGGVRIGSLEGSVLGELELRDVEIRSLDGQPAISIERLAITPRLLSLVRKRVEVDRVTIDGARVVAGPQLTAASDPRAPAGEPSPWSLELPEIEVHRASLVIPAANAELVDIELTAALTKVAGGPLAITTRSRGQWRDRAAAFEVDGELSIGDVIAIERARGHVGGAAFDAQGVALDLATEQHVGVVHLAAAPPVIAQLFAVNVDHAIEVTVTSERAAAGEPGVKLAIDGHYGEATVRGAVRAELATRTAEGFVTAAANDLAAITRGRLVGRGEAAWAGRIDRNGAIGIASLVGELADVAATTATVVVESVWSGAATIRMIAASTSDARGALAAHLRWSRDEVVAERAAVVASASDLAAVAPHLGLTTKTIAVTRLELARPARLWPALDASFVGASEVTGARYADSAVAMSDAQFDGTVSGSFSELHYRVAARGRARGLLYAGEPAGDGEFTAYASGRRVHAQIVARPAAVVGTVARVEGDLTFAPSSIDIALGAHQVSPPRGVVWSGRGGAVRITDSTIAIRDLVTTAANGSVRLDATITRGNGAIAGEVVAKNVTAAAINDRWAGTLSGKLALSRRGGRWQGDGSVVADQVVVGGGLPAIDGDVQLVARDRVVNLTVAARAEPLGSARLELAIDGPKDLIDPAGWRSLPRTAVRSGRLAFERIDLAALETIAPQLATAVSAGRVEGAIEFANGETRGKLDLRGITTPLGVAEGELAVTPLAAKNIQLAWNAKVAELGAGNVIVQLQLPDRPFDPSGWRRLERGALLSLSASFDDVVVDPDKLAKLGVTRPYHGRASVNLTVGPAANAGSIAVTARDVAGGLLVEPIDIHAYVRSDQAGTSGSACVVRHGEPCDDPTRTATRPRLIDVSELRTAVPLERWLTDAKAVLATAVTGKVTIPSQSAPAALALFGRNRFVPDRGTVEGELAVGGTLQRPTARGRFALHHLLLISEVAGRTNPELDELTMTAEWDGETASGAITATQREGARKVGGLTGRTIVRPRQLSNGSASLEIDNLELAPLASLLPGELAASSGRLRGDARVDGFDSDALIRMRGKLELTNGYVPITPKIGTLRDGAAKLTMGTNGIELTAHGVLNGCRDARTRSCTENVTLEAHAPNDVARVDGSLAVTKISPIAEFEPIIDGNARFALVRNGRQWSGDIFIRDGYVVVPPRAGDNLLDADDPEDVFFIESPPPPSTFSIAPTRAWLTANVYLEPTLVLVQEYDVRATLRADNLVLSIGDRVGLDGKIKVERAVAENVFGRPYEISTDNREGELLSFDGSLDPMVDLKLTHQFGGANPFALSMKVQGRVSDPRFPLPRFEGGAYSESELAAIFIGGAPPTKGEEARTAATDAILNAGVAQLSQRVTRWARRVLPKRLQFDVIRLSPSTLSLGEYFRNGRIYLEYTLRQTLLPNENTHEGKAQWYLTDRLYLEALYGNSSIGGADILMRWRL